MRNVSVTWKMKQLFSMTLVLAFILSVILPGSFEVNAAGANVILASEYAGKSIVQGGDTVLVLDKDVTFGVIAINDGSLTIKNKAGENHTVSADSISVLKDKGEKDSCSLSIESGNINVTKWGVYVDSYLSIASGVTLNVNTTDKWDEDEYNYYVGLLAYGNLTTSGNVTVQTPKNYPINLANDMIMNGGNMTVSGSACISAKHLYMNDGKMDLRGTGKYAVDINEVDIKGGNIYLTSDYSPMIELGKKLNISGGYVELKIGSAFGRPWFICPEDHQYNIADNMEVTFYEGVQDENRNETEVPMPYRLMDSDEIFNVYGMFSGFNSYVINKGVYEYGTENYSAKAPRRVIIQEKKSETVDAGAGNTGTGNAGVAGSSAGTSSEASTGTSDGNSASTKYSSEWVNGKWYNADGSQTYQGILSWKCNSTGWWVEDTLGWYPQNQWGKIDGKWYYFLDSGYMDYSEYRDGYWLGSDGALVDGYFGEWKSDSKGWWFEDKSGWYPQSQWVWINGSCYYFESDGYLATNKYIDGYWVGSDGACQ